MNKNKSKLKNKDSHTKNTQSTNKQTTIMWYENTFFVLLMLITVFPLGVFLVLRNERLKADLWPTVKVIIIAAIIIIGVVFLTTDWQKPSLEVKSEMTYNLDQQFGTDQLISDYVTAVSDNDTDLVVEDVSIVKYEDLDLSTPGTQDITFIVQDDSLNSTTQTAKLIIEQ